jgi:Protein of unknown function (DUF2442)
MLKIIDVRPLPGFKILVKFQDGVEGQVDLSDLVGKGVFSKWKEPGFFESVFIDKESHTVAWPGGIDLSPETLYAEITGKSPLKTTHA